MKRHLYVSILHMCALEVWTVHPIRIWNTWNIKRC